MTLYYSSMSLEDLAAMTLEEYSGLLLFDPALADAFPVRIENIQIHTGSGHLVDMIQIRSDAIATTGIIQAKAVDIWSN